MKLGKYKQYVIYKGLRIKDRLQKKIILVNDQTASPHAETATAVSGKARARAQRRFRGV
jgi:hypothetical protein